MTTLESEPGAPWRVAQSECEFRDHQEYLFDLEWGGTKRGLAFCFRAMDNGKIPYAVAPTPPEAAKSYAAFLAKQEAEDRAQEARGGPPPLRFTVPPRRWYYTDSEYSDAVQTYSKKRVADFKLTPELQQELRSRQKAALWEARFKGLEDALAWVFGLCAFIWVFTAVMGWIVRGFAGVPSGQDFKPAAKD